MHILCTICSDLVNQAENITVTKCGHIFHNHCLSQWIGRSKTCPQCRNKVTDKCMFRMFPTISNETTLDDAATLQSRLDDASLQLRQQKATFKEKEDKLVKLTADLKKNEELIKSYEKKIVTRDSAVAALKEQLEYVKIQNLQTAVLKTENENLKKNMQMLNGLQKVLNATSDEVELMLQGYSDVKTLATFATALKRALCESESKLKETREKLQITNRKFNAEKQNAVGLQVKIVDLEDKLALAEHKYEAATRKRKSLDKINENQPKVQKMGTPDQSRLEDNRNLQNDVNSPHLNDAMLNLSANSSMNISFDTMVKKIETADSPYLQLKQSCLPLAAIQQRPQHLASNQLKPSELALINSARNLNTNSKSPTKPITSIFHKKAPPKMGVMEVTDMNLSQFDISFDGLGGHSKLDTFPVPKPKPLANFIPKLTSKHKLKRPNPAGMQDIGDMLRKYQ